MIKVGLTGGIGSGKSAVARLLSSYGAVVIDADAIAREALEPGTPELDRVAAEFGPEVLGPEGTLDRPRLGRIVFADPARLAALNAIVHPYVARRSAQLMAAAPDDAVVVHDVPLLVENGLASAYDVVVVVDAAEQTQLRRLVGERGMPDQDARARMAAQATRQERVAVADVVVDNDGSWEDLEGQVERLWRGLEARC